MRSRLLHSCVLVFVVLALVPRSGGAQQPVLGGARPDNTLPGGAIMMPGTSPERDAMAVVEKLFDGMRAGDSAAVRSVFAPGALLGSVESRNGVSTLRKDADGFEGFAKAVGTPHQAMWDERIANPKIHVDA